MARTRWNERFLASTRGRIVGLLRRGSRTVNELADEVGLTDNAVRAHLAGLERDGLVEQEGVRRAIGKPAHVYRLTEEAESLFPKAYAFLAGQLVAELRERLGEDALAGALRAIGRRAGAEAGVTGAGPLERLGGMLPLLEAIGAEADITREGTKVVITGHACPLATTVGEEPRVCLFLEGVLAGAVDAPVRQYCEHGDRPRCRFEVETAS
jgi:predicted ArsR family transcriptional regulator